MAALKQSFEATLHDLVYSVDAGTGLKVIRTLLFCMVVLVLIAAVTLHNFRALDNEAAMDSAQLGRNLAQSGRYVTQCIRPASIDRVSRNTFNADPMLERHPELLRPPLYPAVLAVVFRLYQLAGVDLFPDSKSYEGRMYYPAEILAIVPVNHLFTVLSGLVLYFLGLRLFSKRIALLGVIVFFLSKSVWTDSLRGDGMSLLLFCVLAAVYSALLSMWNRRERKPLWNWLLLYALSALFAAASLLTHYAALAIIPGIAYFILRMGTRGQRSGHLAFLYFVIVLAVASPWLMNNLRYSGSPVGLAPWLALADTPEFPGDSLLRTLNPEVEPGTAFQSARKKWAANIRSMYSDHFAALGGGLLLPFFLVNFFYRFVRSHVHELRWGLMLSILLMFIGTGFFNRDALRFYHLFLPFVILYGLAFFSVLLDRMNIGMRLFQSALTALLVVLSTLPMILSLPGMRSSLMSFRPAPMPYPHYYPAFVMRVSELLRPGEILCTDMPWATAWYGRRFSILLPQTIDEFYRINEERILISGLYFTTLTKDRPFVSSLLDGPDSTWLPLTMGRLPQDFPLRHGFALNRQDQLFLTDRVRWGAGAESQGIE